MARGALTAVVLAGGAPDRVSALQPGAPNKAFVRIGGITLVERTMAALRTSAYVERIVAVAPLSPATANALELADDVRPDGATMSESLRSGLRGLDPDALVLVCASDLPILSREALDAFVERAEAPADTAADLAYACVEQRVHVARFPDVPHTWARLRDGTYCGGGCVVLRPRVLGALEGLLDRLGRARKNPLRLASIFGPAVLASYASGRLTVADAERRGSELLGARVRAIACAPEIAVNVDRESDVALAERLIRRRDAL